MKTKTINKEIRSKINEWLLSITDESLRERVKYGCVITGGCITSMLLNEPVNDYDIYLNDKQLVKDLSQYYCTIFNAENNGDNGVGKKLHAWILDGQDVADWKSGIKELSKFAYDYGDVNYEPYMEWNHEHHDGSNGISGMVLNTSPDRVKIMVNSDGVASKTVEELLNTGDEISAESIDELVPEKYQPVFLSSNAITLSGKIQIVIRFYGDAEEIHSNYDFSHTTNYWTYKDGVVTNIEALEATLSKSLFYRGSKYPITSIIRTKKFIKRGWNINAGQYLKMCMQISRFDLTDIYVLEDQLVGVDSLYFQMFITNLMKDIEKGNKSKSDLIDNTYVMSVIDKLF